MIEPTTRLAEALLVAADSSEHGTVAPQFSAVMRHLTLPPRDYLHVSKDDPAPLTDLRLRRDASSREMVNLNVSALMEVNGSDWLKEAVASRPADVAVADLVADFALDIRTKPYRRSIEGAPAEDFYVALLKYVNGFGSWQDALAIASEFAEKCSGFEDARPRWLASMLAALVLGLSGREDDGAALADQAMSGLAGTAEAFFVGIRWASLEVKRRGRLEVAERYLERGSQLAAAESEAHALLFEGLSSNLRGLIAMRRGQKELALTAVERAVSNLAASAEVRDPVGQGLPAAERSRYYWMARLNRIQLDVFAGSLDTANQALRELAEWAEKHDPRAVHSTLSILGFVLIREGKPSDAVDVLCASLERLRVEYDPKVVMQVRKMLIRCFTELGCSTDAQEIRNLSPYFWRESAMPRRRSATPPKGATP